MHQATWAAVILAVATGIAAPLIKRWLEARAEKKAERDAREARQRGGWNNDDPTDIFNG